MRVSIVASSPQDPEGNQYLTSFVVDDNVAVDAGSLGIYRDLEDQLRVQNVLLTHSHADHIGSLPVFLENTGYRRKRPVTIYGSAATLDALEHDVFNDRIWPDFSRLNTGSGGLIKLSVLEPEKPVWVDGLRITPVAVDHTVPTFGYIIDDGDSAVVFGGDSGPTKRIWELGLRTSHLRAAFIECTFPVSMTAHARRTGHLTPLELAEEMLKLPSNAEVVVVHVRPAFREVIARELTDLERELHLGRGGVTYTY